MAGVDKYNGKHCSPRRLLIEGNLNYLNYLVIQTKLTIKRDWALDCFSRRINTFVITHAFVPLGYHICTKIPSDLYF